MIQFHTIKPAGCTSHPSMKKRLGIFLVGGLVVLSLLVFNASATPIRMKVEPQGTNQVELTFGPVMPGVLYEVLARTKGPDGHWIMFISRFGGTNKTMTVTADLGGIPGLTLEMLRNWNFVAGCWDDTKGDELPPLYKDLVLRTDPLSSDDPYGDLMGDGWNNLQKMQANMNPFEWYLPPKPVVDVKFYDGASRPPYGTAILTWQVLYGPIPDYFLVARANRTPRQMTNDMRFGPPLSGGRFGGFGTNRMSGFRPMPNSPYGQREDPVVTGPFQVVARVPGQSGVRSYRYVETNVNTLFQPEYRVQAHYSPPLHAHLGQINETTIRNTILPVAARQTTNGYDLTVAHPIPYAWYLLLVRDKNDPQWQASGYFASGTNRNPVHLHVDAKGMMPDGQSPIAMPAVKFLPDVIDPEFTAGWGEDSDGDGLPDIYEVLVTHTDPDNADAGNTGVLDGYKELTDDGWSNLEKFRRRADPLKPAVPPPPIELKRPTLAEIMEATMSPKSDLPYEAQIQIRMAGTGDYQSIEQAPWTFFRMTNGPSNALGNFDLRISWRVPEPRPRPPSGGGP